MELRRDAGEAPRPDAPADVFTFRPRADVGLSSEAVEQLYNELYSKMGNRAKTTRMQAVQCAAFAIACCSPYENVGFLQATSRATKSKYKHLWPGKFKARVFGEVLEDIAKYGLITQHMGSKDPLFPDGITTLWVLTECGREWIQRALCDSVGVSFSDGKELLILKSDKKKPMPFEDDECTTALRAQIRRTNESRARHSWACTLVDLGRGGKEGVPKRIDPDVRVALPAVDLECHRDFRKDFRTGGRFYCQPQWLSKVDRRTITIDGCPTVELDYSSHQTRILYNLSGLDAPQDCYAIQGHPRSTWKKVAVIALYCKSKRQALATLEHHLEVDRAGAKQLLSDYCSHHSAIADKFLKARWGELFYAESQLTMDILDAAYTAGIPVLPIHDSFVAPKACAKKLREIMEACYLERFKFPAYIGEDAEEDADDLFDVLEGQN
ncbi:hypothetical protein [Microbulbifer agarilyticus]|uniref:hypothetical protein n=1 Tax=Microbulbifer agarilyticus TaxID=260552 RepID=UPI001CD1B2E1|nr:hypothetical protein [Microbulbifer agarilyticus]MCA0893857.1 hypothetical protein [Microbulbifer agarilyticus]